MKSAIPLLSLILMSGCTATWKRRPHDFTPPSEIALLLMGNHSNDLKMAELVRKLFHDTLTTRGFRVIPLRNVDSVLLRLGFTDGGQLPAADPHELADSLSADWLVYGTVLEATHVTTGIYFEKTVKVEFEIFSTSEDTTIWESRGRGSYVETHLSLKEAGKRLLEQIMEKAVDTVFNHPLMRQSEEAVGEIAETLPSPKGYYFRRWIWQN